jgi:hypothetical protein
MFSHSTAIGLRPDARLAGLHNSISTRVFASEQRDAVEVLAFDAAATRDRLSRLPTEVGVILIGIGMAGIVLPGMIGVPLILTGGAALMPQTIAPVERWFENRFPGMYEQGMRHVDRFLQDFYRRYPS